MYKHFTIEQKLAAEELTSRDASGTVRLYREGNFYVAYQGSAVLFRRYLKGDLKMLRVVRVNSHLMNHLSLHPTLRTCTSDTIHRAIKELTKKSYPPGQLLFK